MIIGVVDDEANEAGAEDARNFGVLRDAFGNEVAGADFDLDAASFGRGGEGSQRGAMNCVQREIVADLQNADAFPHSDFQEIAFV